MQKKTIFTNEYIQNILRPFLGKKLRMRSVIQDNKKEYKIPFIMEHSIEGSFHIEFNGIGIKYFLKDNYYLKKSLDKTLSDAFNALGIYSYKLQTLLSEEEKEKGDAFQRLNQYLQENVNPQIGFTYYSMISSLRVEDKGFYINDVYFFIVN